MEKGQGRSKWRECYSQSRQRMYYFNELTQETTWEKPEDFDGPVDSHGAANGNGAVERDNNDPVPGQAAKRSRTEDAGGLAESGSGGNRAVGSSSGANMLESLASRQTQTRTAPTHPQHSGSSAPAIEGSMPPFESIANSLYQMWQKHRESGSAVDSRDAPFEIEARIGMVVQDDARWRKQIPGGPAIPIVPNTFGTEFRAGVDESFLLDVKKRLLSRGLRASHQVCLFLGLVSDEYQQLLIITSSSLSCSDR
jgi:hypothetical protein